MRRPAAQRRRDLITVVLVSTLGLGVLVFAAFYGGGMPSLKDTYKIDAVLPSSASLASGARVSMAGVEVGEVKSVRRKGLAAIVELELTDDRVTPIPADSRAQVSVRTAVGENYLTLVPGSSKQMLREGATLPLTQSNEFVDVDEVLSVLQGPSRQRARQLIQGLAGGVEQRGEKLNQLVGGGTGILRDGSRLMTLLSANRTQTSRLVDGLGRVSAAIGERETTIREMARNGRTTFQAVADRDGAVRELLDQLPPTLTQVRRTTTTLRSVTRRATPVVANLAGALSDVRPAVRALRPAAQEGRGVVRELGAASPPLQRTLSRVRALSAPAPAAIKQLEETICQINPMVRYIKPYTGDVISLLIGLGSAANSYDATGHLLRLIPIIDDNTLVGLPPAVNKAAFTLFRSGLLGRSTRLDYEPFPKPGQIGKTVAGDRSTMGPSEVPDTGYRYPRITADC